MNKNLILSLIFVLASLVYAAKPGMDKAYEAQFLDRMTQHHREGIEMAEVAQAKSQNKVIKQMTQKMIQDQSQEIEQMQQWRKQKYGDIPKTKEMPSSVDMTELNTATGKVFDKRFLDKMTEHHDIGKIMFQEARETSTNKQIKKFSKKGAIQQEEEIENMQRLKSTL